MPGRISDELRRAARSYGERHPVARTEVEAETASGSGHSPFRPLAIVLIAALFIGSWFVYRQLQENSKLQDCLMSGRKNCVPIDTGSPNR